MSGARVLKYIELKSGHSDSGPAWIAHVKVSKSGRTVYFNGKALQRATGGGISGNHLDIESREEYWVSGVKKDGRDRHWAGSGVVWIEASAVAEYLRVVGAAELDTPRLQVIADLPEPEIARFNALENERLHPQPEG
jgi:hypothetical protein